MDCPQHDERALLDAAWAQFEGMTGRCPARLSDAARTLSIPGYRILGEIHRGGQGVVYQAIQESTRQKVAIKILKEGPLADPTVWARFDREVDVLSRLSHPYIVTVHDRGLTAGHAYYVMDYVAGRPIDAYVAGANCSTDEILQLFVAVCDAVNAAHLRGIIHRDLKPGNILVVDRELDAAWGHGRRLAGSVQPASRFSDAWTSSIAEPRLLDFGLARLIEEASAERSAPAALGCLTTTGQFIGSLPWASPEQVAGATVPDIRTDVYSLGVILFQLLTSRFPYPVSGRMDDVVRHITETGPARLATFRRRFDADVELIVMKCLAKEPERRYQSAGELAADIRHYLAHEPVSATFPGAAYRLRKFVRRNRGAVIGGAVVVASLIVGTAVSVTFGLREARLRRAAEISQERAQRAEGDAKARAQELAQVAGFEEEQLADIDPEAMGARIRASLLEKSRMAAESSGLTAAEGTSRAAELEELVAGADFTGIALTTLQEDFFTPALTAINREFDGQPVVQARLLQTLATTMRDLGLLDMAREPQERALEIRRQELGDDHRDTMTSVASMGLLLRAQGELAEAEPLYREALERRRAVLGDEDPETLSSLHNMGALLQAEGRLSEAEPFYREALEQRRRLLGEDDPDTLTSMSSMGYLLLAQGKSDEAEPYYRDVLAKRRRILGDDHPHTLFSINNMAALLQTRRRYAEAEKLYREALERRRRVLGEEHPDTLQSFNNLASVLEDEGKVAEAERLYRKTLEIRRRVLGDAHPSTLNSIGNLGALLQRAGRLDEAEPLTREAMETRRRILGDAHVDTLISINNLAILRQKQGRVEEAVALLRDAHRGARDALGAEHPYALALLTNLSSVLEDDGRSAEAVDELAADEPAVRHALTGTRQSRLAHFLTTLGHARVAAGQYAAAQADLSEAYAIQRGAADATDQDRAYAAQELVDLYDAWNLTEPNHGHDAEAAQWRRTLDAP